MFTESVSNIKDLNQRVIKTFFSTLLILSLCILTNIPVYAATFTPGMSKRNVSGAPFAAGPIIQSKLSTSGATGDSLTYSRGTQVSGNFYANFDKSQGSIVFWVTPEWNGNDGQGHSLITATSDQNFFITKDTDNTLYFYPGGNITVSVDISSWVAGTTYNVVARWDSINTLNGTNYASLSINDSHTFGVTSAPTVDAPGTSITIGQNANVHIEGLTIYRRPLWDGTYGIDVGNGDEINQIYNSGTGKDPTLVTGSWDVVFVLPTNASTGALTTGTGNAWSHPHASNLLYTDATNTGGFMMNGTYASDGWTDQNPAQTLTLQPDAAAGFDGSNLEGLPDYAGGATDTHLYTGSTHITGARQSAYLKFDVSSIPAGSTINSATFYIYSYGTLTADINYKLNNILAANSGWTEDANWNYAIPSTQRWVGDTGGNGGTDAGATVSGTDYSTTNLGTFTHLSADPIDTEYAVTLDTAEVTNWLTANYGFKLTAISTAFYLGFRSSDWTTAANRPKLVVNYTAPTTVTALSSSEKIFAGGYKATSTAANQGIYRTFTATNGGDYVLRALGHSDGTCNPQVKITRADGTTEISHLNGTTTSTKTDPDVYIFTWESPAAESEQVQLINTASSGTCYWHQVEVLANLVNNPSAETGSGDPWIPTGWNNSGLDAGEGIQETTDVHSGSSSMHINANAGGEGVLDWYNKMSGASKYSSAGVWTKRVSASNEIRIYYYRNNNPRQYETTVNSSVYGDVLATSWTPQFSVYRYQAGNGFEGVRTIYAAAEGYVDDAYLFALSDVSLTITPASEANSTETSGLRIDGLDTYVESSQSTITTTAGYVSFSYTPRHSAADVAKFGISTPYILSLYGDGDDYINAYWSSANTVTLAYSMNGTTASSTWNATGAVVGGTTYASSLSFTGGGSMVLNIGGTDRITLSSIPASFGASPDDVYFGTDYSSTNQGDATYGSIVFDSTAPAISLTAYTPDPNSDNTPSVTGTATEAIGTVSAVQYQMDGTGGSWTACVADDGTFNGASEAFTCAVSPSLSDGSHTIYVRATDSNSNTTSGGAESTDGFTIDTTAPSAPGTPSTTSPTGSSSQTWTWTAATDALSSVTNYIYKVTTDAAGLVISIAETTLGNVLTVTTNLTDGVYYFFVKAVDALSNTGAFSTAGSVTVDTVAPTGGTITIASGAGYTKDRSVTLSISATGASQMMVSESSSFSGASLETYATSKDWSLSTSDGTKTVYVKFKDTTGNESSSVSDSIIYDTTSPADTLSLDSPGDKIYTSNQKPTFKFKKTTDDTAGLNGYDLLIDGQVLIGGINPTDPGSGSNNVREDDDKHIRYDGDFIEAYVKRDSKKLTDGSHLWKVRAIDNAGNTRDTGERTLYVDTISPALQLDSISTLQDFSHKSTTNEGKAYITVDSTPTLKGIAESTSTVTITATDNVDSKTVTCDDETSSSSAWECTIDTLSLGRHTVTITAKDKAGNSTTLPLFYLYISLGSLDLDTKIIAIDEAEDTVNETTNKLNNLPTDNDSCRIYSVSSGDNLWDISTTYDVSIDKIIDLNKDRYQTLKTNNTALAVGWKLRLQCEENKQETEQEKTERLMETKTYDVKILVKDDKDQPVAGATVTLHSTPRTAISDKRGIAHFPDVPYGEHAVVIAYDNYVGEEKLSFKDENIEQYEVGVDIRKSINYLSYVSYGVNIILIVFLVSGYLYLKRKRKK